MGASWLEIESLLEQLDEVTAFPHSEALMPVTRARDTVAEAAMIVSRAGISGDPHEEAEAQMAMARARVTLHDAQIAVRRAHEAVIATQVGCDRAQRLIEEARALRARDGGPDLPGAPRGPRRGVATTVARGGGPRRRDRRVHVRPGRSALRAAPAGRADIARRSLTPTAALTP